MTRFRKSIFGAAGLTALMLFPASGWANAEHHPAATDPMAPSVQGEERLAHMGAGADASQGMMGPAQGYRQVPCQSYGHGIGPSPGMGQGMMGQSPGMMGPGMMGPGMMGPGMMGPGMMGPGMMGPGMMGSGMMGPGMVGPGMVGQQYGSPDADNRVVPDRDLTANDVRHFLKHRLEMRGNKRLKLGDVSEADDDRIVAEITTMDGSLVERLEIDRHTGEMRSVE